MGGLPRRMAALEEHRKNAPEGLLLLDAGNLFACNSKKSCGKPGQVAEILKSYQSMSYDAVNLSRSDLNLGIPFLKKKEKSLQLPFISANLVDRPTGKPLFNPFVIKKVGENTAAIFGLMEPLPSPNADNPYTIKTPSEAAREMISRLSDQADLIIALSSLSNAANSKLLEELVGLDFIIGTDKRLHAPIKVRNGYILSAGDKGKYLGRLDISLSDPSSPRQIQDIGQKARLESKLSRVEQKIAQLEAKKADITTSNNDRAAENYGRAVANLRKQQAQTRAELANWDADDIENYFEYKIMPLGARKPRKALANLPSGNKAQQTSPKSHKVSATPHIKIRRLAADANQRITFVLAVDQAPNQVRALGFDVVFDPQVLKYSGYTRGVLIERFDMFDVNALGRGRLRVGGLEARNDFMAQGASGELVRLQFQVLGNGDPGFKLIRLRDHISSWGVKSVRHSGRQEMESSLISKR
jgi:hypothetical protein